jgi:hypothetical protein
MPQKARIVGSRLTALVEMYEKGMSVGELEGVFEESHETIRKTLKRSGISLRSRSEAQILALKKGTKTPPMLGRKKSECPAWKGGKRIDGHGYVTVLLPEHPRAHKNGYVYEHILVLEEKLGRSLLPGEDSHHIDEVKTNNHPDNLEVLSHGGHRRHHNSGESSPLAKLTWEKVREIREIEGKTLKSIAADYGVSLWTIGVIRRNKTWQECLR